MSQGKSGFEIRADLLSQAQGLLMDNRQNRVDAIQYNNEVFGNKDLFVSEELDTDKVIETAKALYNFVNEK
jgi:hypothetical protein